MRQHEKTDRPTAYPKPSETDQQLNNQPEYIDQQPNSREKDISDVPAKNNTGSTSQPASAAKNPKARRRGGYRETY